MVEYVFHVNSYTSMCTHISTYLMDISDSIPPTVHYHTMGIAYYIIISHHLLKGPYFTTR